MTFFPTHEHPLYQRMTGAALLALVVTAALLALMAHLTKRQPGRPIIDTLPPVLDLAAPPRTTPVRHIKRKLPPPEPRVLPATIPLPGVDSNSQPLIVPRDLNLEPPGSISSDIAIERQLRRPGDRPAQQAATPVVRIEPVYPVPAARDGISGWITLSFTVTATGQVSGIRVLNTSHRGLFDKEARRAVKRWRYRPQIIDGRLQPFTTSIRLDFNLNH